MMTTPALKTCASCNAERPTAQFLPTRISDDGLTDSCRACDYGHTEWDWRERGRRVRLALTFGAIEPLETREHPEVPKR